MKKIQCYFTLELEIEMFYVDLRHNVKKIEKSSSSSANAFFYITRTAHFSNSSEKEQVEFVKSANMPNFAINDPKKFWIAADKYEQKNGRTSSTLTIALPNFISKKQRIELAEQLIDEFAKKNGFAFTCAIHNHASSLENKEQPHLHFMYSERPTRNNEHLPAKQFFSRYNVKNPDRGGVRKLTADALGYGKNHVDHIRKTTEKIINDYLTEHAPTKKIFINDLEIEVPSFVSCLSNRDYNQKFGTNLKDVEQLARFKLHNEKYHNKIAEKLDAIRRVREFNRYELYGKYYEAELDRRAKVADEKKRVADATLQAPASTGFKFSETLDVERLEKAFSFDKNLLSVMQSIRDFAHFDAVHRIKSKSVRYGYSQYEHNQIAVYDVFNVKEHRLQDDFKKNYTDYCLRVLNALETHYDTKLSVMRESLSLNISKFDLNSVCLYDEQHREILTQIIEPIKIFSMNQKNEVFSDHLVSLENKEMHIKSVFEQVKQHQTNQHEIGQKTEYAQEAELNNRFEL